MNNQEHKRLWYLLPTVNSTEIDTILCVCMNNIYRELHTVKISVENKIAMHISIGSSSNDTLSDTDRNKFKL